jgi:hypothetical protein
MTETLIRDISIFAIQGKESLIKSVSKTNTIEEAGKCFINSLGEIKREHPDLQIYYVIGAVTTDGQEFIERNLELLKEKAKEVNRKLPKAVVFSAGDIFNRKLFKRFDSHGAVNQDYLDLWEKVLGSGFVDSIIRTPDWGRSVGATHENNIAHQKGLRVYDYFTLMDRM